MDITISPHKLIGTLSAVASKSMAHRLLICAAFADKETLLECAETNDDISATVDCLCALGAVIARKDRFYRISPAERIPPRADLYCKESGSTLRFLLPVVGALGVNAVFHTEGRLWHRPLSPLWEEMERMGCKLSRPVENLICCSGKLSSGIYRISASVSSQFISGLLFALTLIPGSSELIPEGCIESAPYISMTIKALQTFGVDPQGFCFSEKHRLSSPGMLKVEGDWSNAAFFIGANAIGNSINMINLDSDSAQGDKEILNALPSMSMQKPLDVKDIPDLVPILAVVAGAKDGAVFHNIRRLRLKESDRVLSVCSMITSLGGNAECDENTLTVYPGGYSGGIVDAFHDHRIAMAAAIAATISSGPVKIIGAECVKKSYPLFWEDYRKLGGVL